ncbi:MAG: cytochrome c [Bacteroidales bacterium]|nr:cytochrome c [Bacteroidales bacterium]
MNKLLFNFLFILFSGIILISSCKHKPEEIAGPNNPTIEPPIDTLVCDSSDVTYQGIVYPILETYCISCHSGPTPSGALDFSDYRDVAFVAQSGQLAGAIKHLDGFEPMPQDGNKLSNCEISLIEKWINDTTFVMPPDITDCDTSFVTYPETIYPILQANCISCHGPPLPEAGLDFTDYSDVAYVAENGTLLGAIKHLSGFEPMPQNAPPLTDCEITLIEKWIKDTIFIIPPDTTICDSSNVTYPGTVFPILQQNCITCHSQPIPAGGLDFNDYENVAFVAQSGQLMGAIRQLPPYTPMPENGPPLTDCEIGLIQKWINDTTFNTGSGGISCDPDTIYFQNDVLPLLQSSCGIAGCHDQQSAQDGVVLTSYLSVMQTAGVVPFDPQESEIYEVITENDPDDRMPPPPAAPLNSDQIQIIYKWIAQGALNNYCDQEDCDSVNVIFSETVFPIIQNKCYGCHSGSNPSGGISLTNYNQVKAQASIPVGSPGSLLGAITWANGNTPMPQNGNQLSECNIAQIRNWIDDGMPDN